MSARIALSFLAGVLVCGDAAVSALADDFGVSFRYSSGPRYYASSASRGYTNYSSYGCGYGEDYEVCADPVV